MRAILQALSVCRIFTGLSESELLHVAEFTLPKTIGKGEYLFRAGDVCHGFYVVQSGAISVHRTYKDGREQMILMARSGESFAEGSLIMEKGYPASARADIPSSVLLIQKEGFVNLLRKKPEYSLRMLTAMSWHLRDLVQQIEDLTAKDVETRLANWLLKRCRDVSSSDPFDIDIKITKKLLAAELGTIPETLSRSLAKFREEGLIEVKGRVMRILNPSALDAIYRRHLGE